MTHEQNQDQQSSLPSSLQSYGTAMCYHSNALESPLFLYDILSMHLQKKVSLDQETALSLGWNIPLLDSSERKERLSLWQSWCPFDDASSTAYKNNACHGGDVLSCSLDKNLINTIQHASFSSDQAKDAAVLESTVALRSKLAALCHAQHAGDAVKSTEIFLNLIKSYQEYFLAGNTRHSGSLSLSDWSTKAAFCKGMLIYDRVNNTHGSVNKEDSLTSMVINQAQGLLAESCDVLDPGYCPLTIASSTATVVLEKEKQRFEDLLTALLYKPAEDAFNTESILIASSTDAIQSTTSLAERRHRNNELVWWKLAQYSHNVMRMARQGSHGAASVAAAGDALEDKIAQQEAAVGASSLMDAGVASACITAFISCCQCLQCSAMSQMDSLPAVLMLHKYVPHVSI